MTKRILEHAKQLRRQQTDAEQRLLLSNGFGIT